MLDINGLFEAGSYTTDWFTKKANLWFQTFGRRSDIKQVLEIGSWEGRSAVFLSWLFENAHISCIDTWNGGAEHGGISFDAVEERFHANTKYFADRLSPLKGRSSDILPNIDGTFDFIYIDGSHHYPDVMIDSLLCWAKLNPGGIMVWDDYHWRGNGIHGRLTPKMAIDQFLTAHRGQYAVLFAGPQVAIRKTNN